MRLLPKKYQKELTDTLRTTNKNMLKAGFKIMDKCPKCGENSLSTLAFPYCMLCGYAKHG